MIHAESLAVVCGEIQNPESRSRKPEASLHSPGLLPKHYSPKAKLLVLDWKDDAHLQSQLSTFNFQLSTCFVIAHAKIPASGQFADVSVMPHDAAAFARALYAELHRGDEAGAELIVVEAPPEAPEWSGIADRLRRAAA
jgi:L-threonylcarbamoyladenylate synthase